MPVPETTSAEAFERYVNRKCLVACRGEAWREIKAWIPGTTKLHRLDENLGAAAVELTAEDLRDIESAAAKIKVEGARYLEQLEQLTGR